MKFSNKKILIGITGGIAAYKTCWLIRAIKKQGGEVRVVLTGAGSQFITPVTLEALSGQPVARSLFEPGSKETIQHIDLARWPDCFVIAPATANIIGKAANGIADDILSTIISAYPGRILFAPAMNDVMWKNPATRENIKKLKKFKHHIINPGTGDLACETIGAGRMAEPEEIEQEISKILGLKNDFAGKNILVTLGGTEEPIDPVRGITNRSSGKMGAAIAEAALARGANVTVIAGKHTASLPEVAKLVNAVTAAEMSSKVKQELKNNDVLIMAAAVADYRPVDPAEKKLKKSGADDLVIRLEKTEDILKTAGKNKSGKILVGFSLETHGGPENARKKLKEKNLDLIVLNNPLEAGAGFGSDTNKVTIFDKNGKSRSFPVMTKFEVANVLLDRIVTIS